MEYQLKVVGLFWLGFPQEIRIYDNIYILAFQWRAMCMPNMSKKLKSYLLWHIGTELLLFAKTMFYNVFSDFNYR